MVIILTHSHVDHDVGIFQNVLSEQRRLFTRDFYSLSPSILRHSHRHKLAILIRLINIMQILKNCG